MLPIIAILACVAYLSFRWTSTAGDKFAKPDDEKQTSSRLERLRDVQAQLRDLNNRLNELIPDRPPNTSDNVYLETKIAETEKKAVEIENQHRKQLFYKFCDSLLVSIIYLLSNNLDVFKRAIITALQVIPT
jgi:peptidoglycan hydrolase CwlO-like protein